MLLRTTDAVIEALRARKEALQLSDATVDHLAGLTPSHTGKVLGPSREKMPTLATLMYLVQALGLAVQFIEDPDSAVRSRWQRRGPGANSGHTRVSKTALKRIRPLILAELARKGGVSWWANKSPEERHAHIARLNAARAAKRQAGLNKAA